MKRVLVIVFVLALAGFVSGVMAQQKPETAPAPAPVKPLQKPKIENLSGPVQKVDETSKTIVVKGTKKDITFTIDEKTKITRSGKVIPLADLKEGMRADVQYKKDGDKLIATRIKAAPPKPVSRKPASKPQEPQK